MLVVIGRVESLLAERDDAPKQGEGAPGAWLVFEPAVGGGLRDLHVGDEAVVLTWLDRADRSQIVVHPRDDAAAPLTGVFATRSADRPNPIGLHPARIVAIDGLRIRVDRLEAIDGTPIVDVKPVLPPSGPDAVQWEVFSAASPDLAALGEGRLAAAPSYLATVRAGGAPRVHPVTAIIGTGRLLVFMEPTSPKVRDLRRRGRYALHSGVPDTAGTGGEFFVHGRAEAVDDPDVRAAAARAAPYEPAEGHVLFELLVSEARCVGYGDVRLPEEQRWRAPARTTERPGSRG